MWQRRIFYLVVGLVVTGFLTIGLMLVLQASARFIESFPTPDPKRNTAMLQKFFNASMKYDDVPWKYRYSGQTESIERDGGWGESRVQYANELAPMAHIRQDILIFPSREMATRSVELQKVKPPPIEFNEIAHDSDNSSTFMADSILFGCDQPARIQAGLRSATGRFCVAIGQYGRVVMRLKAQVFDEPFLTMDEYLSLLAVLDTRVAKAFDASQ